MTTSIEDDSVKLQLLESFPLSPVELDRLLRLYAVYDREENGSFTLAHWLALAPSDEFGNEEDLPLLKRVEEEILPPELASKLLKKALDTVIVLGCDDTFKNERTFLEAMVTLLGRRGHKSIIELIYSAAQEDARMWVYRLAVASHVLGQNSFPEALQDLTTPQSWMSDRTFAQWATWDAPGASTALSTLMHLCIFSVNHPFRPSVPPLILPQQDEPSSLWRHPWQDLPLSLALMSPKLGGQWRRLYSNDCDGFSFRTMQESVLSFQGPTVLLIRSTAGDVIGFSTDCPWKTSRKWFGEGSDSFLFTLHPKLAFYPATGDGKHHMYLNLPGMRHPKDLRGMAIGGIAQDRPRLHLTESLEKCRACDIDVTYTPGPLLSNDMEAYFDVDVLEVWATNETEVSFQAFAKKGAFHMSVREATRQQVAKVDKHQFVDDFANGTYLNKGFNHREHTSDRHDYTMEDFKESINKM